MIFAYERCLAPESPDRAFFTIPYNDREQREYMRHIHQWPGRARIDERTMLALGTWPRIAGKDNDLVAWLCQSLTDVSPNHQISNLQMLVPVVVEVSPAGRLTWPQIAHSPRNGTDPHVDYWLHYGQAFVIVRGFDDLIHNPDAVNKAREEIQDAIQKYPKCRWFVNSTYFCTPPEREQDAVSIHAGKVLYQTGPIHTITLPTPKIRHVVALEKMRDELVQTIVDLTQVAPGFNVESVIGRTAALVYPNGEISRVDITDADIDGNPLEALEAIHNLLGYYA